MGSIHENSTTTQELSQGYVNVYKHMLSYASSMALKCAIELGIPDIIFNKGKGQTITLHELASALQIPPSRTSFLRRVMRVLVHSGIFSNEKQDDDDKEEGEEVYGLTPSSKLLLTNGNNNGVPSVGGYVLAVLEPVTVTAFSLIGNWLKKDSPPSPFHLANDEGLSLYEYWGKNVDGFGDRLDEGMESDSGVLKFVLKDFKSTFEGITSLVDVGGNTGSMCRMLIAEFPHLKCSVFDLPYAVEANSHNSTPNLKFIEGDMFQTIPQADAILFKSVLSGCSDEECMKILKNCREAISKNGGGKVLIIDNNVIDSKKDEHQEMEAKLYFDMLMMSALTGRERTKKDWEKIFFEAGFTHCKITHMFGLKSLIEVFP
ncbi:trans-resveratrol di-O-methyltransferase-like [Cannabis sativa]|uniref:trans-resveratrol di-O-methyltransferase-like n=1 Tax=Cannabis sativa TaxID=3483 RepID=UPI0011DF9137|nr:trans-resveratrol di-O-methyltransferase-like [Cannabis sativa]